MKLVKATDADNEDLLLYFSQIEMAGAVSLKQRRMFHFFNQYRIQSNDYVTYLLKNEKNEIEAMASMIFRKGHIEDEEQTIGFATDLRVSPTRRAILNWSHHFLPVLEEERSKRNCKYIFSVVPHSQRQAYNAFIRPRQFKRKMPRYHLFHKFNTVTLHGLWPFHDLPLTGIKIRTANQSDWPALAQYILKKTSTSPLYYGQTPEDLEKNISMWHDLSIASFLLALDTSGRIIGCTAPWSPERVQRLSPKTYDSRAKNFYDLLKFLSWFRIAHPLPPSGGEFHARHLTHLHADNPDIFYSLLYQAFKMSSKTEFLVYPHFHGDLLTLPPRSFISAQTEYGLYCILSPDDPTPNFLRPRTNMQTPPQIETAFL